MKKEKLSFGAWEKENLSVIIANLDAWEAHKGPITQLYYDENKRILVTGGKDRSIRVTCG